MSGAARTGQAQRWLGRHWLKLAVSLAMMAGFALILRAGALPLWPDAEAFARARWWTIPAYAAIWSAVHFIRAARWSLLLRPVARVPLRRVVAVCFIGFAAIVMLPFRTGEMARPLLIRKKGELSGWEAVGTVGAERIIDGLFLTVLLFTALKLATPLDPLPDRIGALAVPVSVVPRAAYAALALFATAFMTMGVFYWRRTFARAVTERVIGLVSPRLARWLADRVEKVAAGLGFLPRARYSGPFVLMTAAYWFLNAAGTWLLAWGMGFDSISYAQACVNMGVLALGILIPNVPGFFGQFQIAIYAGFALYFPPAEVVGPGAAYVLVIYLVQLGITLAAALGGMLAERSSVSVALALDASEP